MPSVVPAVGVVFSWDRPLFRDVNAFTRDTPWLHGGMLAYAAYGTVLFAALLLVGWWVARSSGDLVRVAAALWAPVGALVALAINQLLVNAWQEPRPYDVLSRISVLASRSNDYSFPSDHAVMAGAVAGGLFLVHRRLGAVALAAALLMAFARVYIGAHWPGDVLACWWARRSSSAGSWRSGAPRWHCCGSWSRPRCAHCWSRATAHAAGDGLPFEHGDDRAPSPAPGR
jgi:membrane-associated phospholipid phosphatase